MDLRKEISRRALLTRAAPVLAGSLAAISPACLALAEEKSPRNVSENNANEKIWSGEYWAKKGDIALYIFRKRLGAPNPGEMARPIVFLAHGSSVSARPSFDLTVPGHG